MLGYELTRSKISNFEIIHSEKDLVDSTKFWLVELQNLLFYCKECGNAINFFNFAIFQVEKFYRCLILKIKFKISQYKKLNVFNLSTFKNLTFSNVIVFSF